MNLYNMALWGTKKGLDILATGDWTHPLWLREIRQELEEDSQGIFKLKNTEFLTRFILSVEISSIYSRGAKSVVSTIWFSRQVLKFAKKSKKN